MNRPLRPPARTLLALESLATLEHLTYFGAAPLFAMSRRGDGHPVLVLPGFTGTDHSTGALRAVLRGKGYHAVGWGLGTNNGPRRSVIAGMTARLLDLHSRTGQRVSVVGWSLGGIYARELARAHGDAVRMVITLGSPFRFREPDRSSASWWYDIVAPKGERFAGRAVPEESREPLPVPSSSIYSRYDGIVRWHACIDEEGPERENIEVLGTHNGLGVNVAATVAILDRLAQPEGQWAPFRPRPALRAFYPTPASWRHAQEEQEYEDQENRTEREQVG